MGTISDVRARLILDSRGSTTVEVEVHADGAVGRAAAPSGASVGTYEVAAWPDGGAAASLSHLSGVVDTLTGVDPKDQATVDGRLHELDGTGKFSRLGGNLAVAVSLANSKAAAMAAGKELYDHLGGARGFPRPVGNMIGGGRHASGGTDIQEFLSVAHAQSAAAAVFANAAVHKAVFGRLREMLPGTPLAKGDEAAWVAPIRNEEALEVLAAVCAEVSGSSEAVCRPGLDIAASELYHDGAYVYREGRRKPSEQVDFVAGLVEKFEMPYVEDPFQEDDFGGFTELTKRVGDRCLIVGDDLFVTSTARIEEGIREGAANAVLIKPNQCGTLTDTKAAIDLAHGAGYRTVMSHRSGETWDPAIAHLAVAFGCWGLKCGAVGGERVAKLNELLRIEGHLGGQDHGS